MKHTNRLGLATLAIIGTIVAGCAGQDMATPLTLKIGETTYDQAHSALGEARVTKTTIAGNPVKICEYQFFAQDNNVVPSKNSLSIKTEKENALSQMGSGQMRLMLFLSFTNDKLTLIKATVIPTGRFTAGSSSIYTIPDPASDLR